MQNSPRHIHFIGIGGSGLSAIARCLLEDGWLVTGSDRQMSPMIDELRRMGARIFIGHTAENIAGAELVVRSSAVAQSNPEIAAAVQTGIPVLCRREFLSTLTAGKKVIAVAGTHGKTTTTAMVTWILHQAGLDPSYIIGGVSKNLGGNAHAGKGEWFVIEADEYDTMFLGLDPAIAAITTLEHDHPDCFPTAEEYRAAFCAFAARTVPGGGLVLSQDHLEVANLAVCAGPGVRALTCGLDPTADILGSGVNRNSEGGFSCEIFDQGIYRTTLNLCVPGHHNIANAVTAYAVCSLVGIPADQISQALASFIGTGRRFDIYGIIDGITLIDDYAHHPTAIRETLAAARNRYPASRLIAVWQPHTYSRTRALMDDYCQAFADADMVILTDIYAAREPAADFTAASVAEKINTPSVYIPSLELITERLSGMLQQGDVVLVLSAGDAIRLNPLLADELRKKEACR